MSEISIFFSLLESSGKSLNGVEGLKIRMSCQRRLSRQLV